jgi:hypothetical protein
LSNYCFLIEHWRVSVIFVRMLLEIGEGKVPNDRSSAFRPKRAFDINRALTRTSLLQHEATSKKHSIFHAGSDEWRCSHALALGNEYHIPVRKASAAETTRYFMEQTERF